MMRNRPLALIDTHAHLDEIEDLNPVIMQAKESGIIGIIAAGSDYASNQKTMQIAQEFPGFVFPAFGLHPQYLAETSEETLRMTLEQISTHINQIVAIGEIGLDYQKRVRGAAPKDYQQVVLRRFLKIAEKHNKPVLLHSRYAWKDALVCLKDAGISRAVFHWFTGPNSILTDITEAGYYVSFSPALEYHPEHRAAIINAPLDKLLLETDTPVEYGQDERYSARPKDVQRSLRAAAILKNVEESVVAEHTTLNAIRLLGLPRDIVRH